MSENGASDRPAGFPEVVRAAIFDFDETMIDLEAQHDVAYAALARELGDDYTTMPESFRFSSGRRVIDDVRAMRQFFGWTQDEDVLMAHRQRVFDEAVRRADLHLLPGVKRLVEGLSERDVRLAIASSAVASSIEAVLERFSLRRCFAVIIDGAQVVRGKPDPEAFLVTLERLGTAAEETIVFEDSEVGVLAAIRAGTYCVAVPNRHARVPQDVSAARLCLTTLEEFDLGWVGSQR